MAVLLGYAENAGTANAARMGARLGAGPGEFKSRIWDDQPRPTQTQALWVQPGAECDACVLEDGTRAA
jgi:hypothetical protein